MMSILLAPLEIAVDIINLAKLPVDDEGGSYWEKLLLGDEDGSCRRKLVAVADVGCWEMEAVG
ncbi:MAG: hypothetical protein LBT62_08235 [Deltaproteobacteria bacterium]|nr:hypothetical protein [Deltaproteobacteria bacterium]